MTTDVKKYFREKEAREKKQAAHGSTDYYDADPFDIPRCPACGEGDHYWWDRGALGKDGAECELTCSCGATYITMMHVATSFRSYLKGPKR